MQHHVIAQIDLSALAHNIQLLRARIGGARILGMIKANAYGHGVATCLPAFEPVDGLGVASLEEAADLRVLGWAKVIVSMEGGFSASDFQWCAAADIQPVIHSLFQAEILGRTALTKPLSVWVEVDTGMHRQGLMPAEVVRAQYLLAQNPQVHVVCWSTHFSEAALELNEKIKGQLERFSPLQQGWAGVETSFAPSACLLGQCLQGSEGQQGHWVRPGLMLYGASPVVGRQGSDFGLKPVMRLSARVIAKRWVPSGEAVGYASTWTAPEPGAWVATVSMGYGDGYPWRIEPRTPVWYHGQELPIIGRVSMDSLAVQATAVPDLAIGDELILWGPELPVERIAAQAGTLPYVLLAGLTGRVKRTVLT